MTGGLIVPTMSPLIERRYNDRDRLFHQPVKKPRGAY